MNALAHDLNYPALRKNKNIEAFLNRCKSCSLFAGGQGSRVWLEKNIDKFVKCKSQRTPVMRS